MILRKPYAFFIKIFRPIHFVFAICIGFLIVYQNKILSFLNEYLYSTELIDTKNIKSEIINSAIFILPIVFMILSLLLFSIMYKKKKPSKFYLFSIFIYIVILIINIYASNSFAAMEETTIAIKIVKLIHDLILMAIITETILLIIYIIRGIGLNFKKFDFSSDISKFDISDEDKEEFELDIKLDLNETRRKRKEKIRNFKYYYLEHKFMINLGLTFAFFTIVIISIIVIFNLNNYNGEGKTYSFNNIDMNVENTYLLNTNHEGNTITNNYLIVVQTKLKSSVSSKSLFLKDFSLKIGNSTTYPTNSYNKYLNDLGTVYDNQILSNNFNSYLFIYEIPNKFITSDMFFQYSDNGYKYSIKLNPKDLKYGKDLITSKLNKEIKFNDSLGEIAFNIKEYEINDYYKINYNYCAGNNCVDSIEYLRPSIDENFDKSILRLDVDYINNSNLDLYSFYNLLDNFGDLYYKINGEWNVQSDNFEQITSKKGENFYTYIGVNIDVKNAESIKFVFDIRGLKYEYTIK